MRTVSVNVMWDAQEKITSQPERISGRPRTARGASCGGETLVCRQVRKGEAWPSSWWRTAPSMRAAGESTASSDCDSKAASTSGWVVEREKFFCQSKSD